MINIKLAEIKNVLENADRLVLAFKELFGPFSGIETGKRYRIILFLIHENIEIIETTARYIELYKNGRRELSMLIIDDNIVAEVKYFFSAVNDEEARKSLEFLLTVFNRVSLAELTRYVEDVIAIRKRMLRDMVEPLIGSIARTVRSLSRIDAIKGF